MMMFRSYVKRNQSFLDQTITQYLNRLTETIEQEKKNRNSLQQLITIHYFFLKVLFSFDTVVHFIVIQ